MPQGKVRDLLIKSWILSRWQANEVGNEVGKNDLKKWLFETKPVFGHEKAGNQRN